MSIAGVVFGGGKEAESALQSALARLALPASGEQGVNSLPFASFGSTDDSSIFQGTIASSRLLTGFAGNLYERSSLLHDLGLPSELTDAEIVAHAYLRWGDTFPDKLYGEYAIAIWDDGRQRLLLNRDALSRRPLYYARSGDSLCFSSEPRGLIGWPGVDSGLNEETVIRIMTLQPRPGPTMRRGISLIQGAHVFIVEADGSQKLVRYWNPLESPHWIAKDSRDYATALREALVNAVSVRLPATGLIGSQLSSGFDSSGVTALAAQALLKQNRTLVAYTSVPRHRTDASEIYSDRFDDEWPLASQVAKMYPNIEHVAIRTDGADWWEALDVMGDLAGGPPTVLRNGRWYYAILKDARSRGLVTMLEGQAGNFTASYNGFFGLYDLRRRGRWFELAKAVRNRRKNGEPLRALLNSAWLPSPRAKAVIQRLKRNPVPKLFERSLLNEAFYSASGVEQREHSPLGQVIEGNRTSGAAWRLSLIEGGDYGMMRAMHMRGFGLRREDPTADRRLVELCLSIPDEAFAPKGIKRQLYREAFRDDLPPELLSERRRGLQTSDFLVLFEEWLPKWRAELDRLEDSPRVSRYLDLPRMRKMLDDWPKVIAGPKTAADMAYDYTFGGAIAMGRFLSQFE